MAHPIIKIAADALLKGGKAAVKEIGKDGKAVAAGAIGLGLKVGQELIEKQMNRKPIPNLKDAHIDEAIRILRDEVNLVPTAVVAKHNTAYVNESENEVVYTEPKFGTKVDPKTPVKVYYLTQDVIDKSKELLEKQAQVVQIPKVVGLSIDEAQEDLEAVGFKVTRRLEKPNLKFVEKEDGEVIRVTYPDNKKVGAKFKTGERLVVYFVNEEVIKASKAIKDKKIQDDQERIERFKKAAMDMKDGLQAGAADKAQKVGEMIKKPLVKKNAIADKGEE